MSDLRDMSDLISMDKQYKTRDGRAVEVLKVDVKHHSLPVAVVVTNPNGSQCTGTRTSTGRVLRSQKSISDLIEVKPRIKQDFWLNVYLDRLPYRHSTKEEADKIAGSDRIACIKVEIDCEHGEGL